MTSAPASFPPAPCTDNGTAAVEAALRCIEAFTECFNARDVGGMDACLHFPHIILHGEQLVIWNQPGNLPVSFFDDLERDTGWAGSSYQRKEPVLVSPRKIHLVVDYTRNRADGSAASSHSNLWIVTFDDGRWGIKQRSY